MALHNPGHFGGAGNARPVLTSLDQASGVGTTVVTVTGANLKPSTVAYLDSTAQATTWISSTSVSFVAAGTVASHVVTLRDQSGTITISEVGTFEITA